MADNYMPHDFLHTVILKTGQSVMLEADDLTMQRQGEEHHLIAGRPYGVEGFLVFYSDGGIVSMFCIEEVAAHIPPVGWGKKWIEMLEKLLMQKLDKCKVKSHGG